MRSASFNFLSLLTTLILYHKRGGKSIGFRKFGVLHKNFQQEQYLFGIPCLVNDCPHFCKLVKTNLAFFGIFAMIYFLYIFKIKYYTLSILCGESALVYSIRATAANIGTINILLYIVLKIEKESGFPPSLITSFWFSSFVLLPYILQADSF